MASWRLAKSLDVLRSQVNKLAPTRDKSSDGTVGDAAHASRSSDHNPWVKDGATGVVTAMDISHDPAHGVDTYALAELLRVKRDKRLKYVISNSRIWSSETSPFTWRPYSGSNKHDHHVHVSVKSSKPLYDDTSPWDIAISQPGAPAAKARAVLKKGLSGTDVKELQKRLGVPVIGIFDAKTDQAVREFQKESGLSVDGRVGPYTWRALGPTRET